MIKTTYDDIWECFYDNCGVDYNTLPSTDEGKYILIKNGCRKYNTVIDPQENKIKCDDFLEEINLELDDNRLMLLAYCIRYNFLENDLIRYEQVWQNFAKDIGQKFYGDQVKGREATLERTKNEIDKLLLNIESYSYLE